MKYEKNPPAREISTLKELEELAGDLKGQTRVSVDMESDSFYAYHEKVCLLQLSVPKEDIVIDPLAIKDISPLGPMFRDPDVEKVFHAGEYDIVCLKRDYGFVIRNVFDTMVAARTLGSSRLGLAHLIEENFGVKLSKKLQRANWGKRPLSPEHIEYARNDTRYLIPLRKILTEHLEAKGLLRDAVDEFRRLEKLQPVTRQFDPNAFWHLRGARDLTPQKRAVLKRISMFREKTAAELDRAPFRVLPEELMVRLAQSCHETQEALRGLKGMTPYLFRRFGKELLAEIAKGLGSPPIEEPPKRVNRNQWDTPTMRRYEALRQWRKAVAEKRGVNPVVVLPTDEVRLLAEAPSHQKDAKDWLNCISEYKREQYGEEILAILKQPKPERKKKRRSRKSRTQRPEQKA
ncbi:ribonuclease D [Elusimicrobiota bacterium]